MSELQGLFKELVECPVCLEIYNHPKALPCLHTFCTDCIEQTASWNATVRCPLCTKTYKTRDAIHDFRIQQLVDLYLTLDLDISFANLSISGGNSAAAAAGINEKRDNVATNNKLQLTWVMKYTPSSGTRISQVFRQAGNYLFVLNNGKFVVFNETSNREGNVVTVKEKKDLKRSVLGGLMVGLAAAPLGPVAAVVAGITMAGTLAFGGSNIKHTIQSITSYNEEKKIALCDTSTRSGIVSRLVVLNKAFEIESTIANLHGNSDIENMISFNGALYCTHMHGKKVTAWSDVLTGNGLHHILPILRHVKQEAVTMCVDATYGYTNDGSTIFKFTRAQEIVGAYNIPRQYIGGLVFCEARNGKILLQQRSKKTVHLLDTVASKWYVLEVPETDWRPVLASLDSGLCVSVLCHRAGRDESRIYSCRLDEAIPTQT